MSAAITAKAAPSAAAIEEMGWNGLEHLARTSKDRDVLAAVATAAKALAPDSDILTGNSIVSHIVRRAVDHRWSDVLEAAVDSGAMGGKDYVAALKGPIHAPENVHAAILREVRSHATLLATFHRATPYPVLKEVALKMRLAGVTETIRAAKADKAAFEVDEDGYENTRFSAAVTIALELGRLDLVAALINTGCAGKLTIDRARMVTEPQTVLDTAVHNYRYKEGLVLAA